MIDANIAALLYLVSGILFILALRGLSHPSSSRQGNLFGMIGMGIAVVTTLAVAAPSDFMSWLLIISGLALGGGAENGRHVVVTFDIGFAREIEITAVGLAFAREGIFQILFGLGVFQCRHWFLSHIVISAR